MRRTIRFDVLVGLALFGGAPASAQKGVTHYQFRVWQFLPDGSLTNPGTMSGVASEDEDFHMFITLGSGAAPLVPDIRLDGDFAVHRMEDSTLFVGDITAMRVLGRDSTKLFARDMTSEDRLERRVYRMRVTTTGGAPLWFYPFGVPRRGERGIAFELTSAATEPRDSTLSRSQAYRLPEGAVAMSYGIEGVKRAHRARVLVEVVSGQLQKAFEGELLTRVPVRIPVKGGGRGQDLMFEVEAEERPGERCWRWFWADEKPPGGFGCGSPVLGRTVEQSLDGSVGLKMRVTLLP